MHYVMSIRFVFYAISAKIASATGERFLKKKDFSKILYA